MENRLGIEIKNRKFPLGGCHPNDKKDVDLESSDDLEQPDYDAYNGGFDDDMEFGGDRVEFNTKCEEF